VSERVGKTGRFLLVGHGAALEELGAALAGLGHEIARLDTGAGAGRTAEIAASADAAIIAAGVASGVAAGAVGELPVAWVCARADLAAIGEPPRTVDLICLPLGRAEIAARAGMLLARRQLARDQAESRRTREMVLAMAVHDLKNPLATVIGNAEYLDHAPELSADSRESVVDLLASAGLLGRVVMELVDVGRALDGPLVPALAAVDLDALLAEVTRTARPRAAALGVALAYHGQLGPTPMELDRHLVRRLVDTLLDNALRFAPRETTVTIRARAVDGAARIELCDQGHTIPAAELAHIFDRAAVFEQTTSGRSQRAVRRLATLFCLLVAEAHGGRVWAESAPGGGTNFCVELPRR
jgi:signal transduction histidine kinase